MPFWNEFTYSERFGVGFFEAYATPRRVREYYALFGSLVDAERHERDMARQQAMMAQRG